MSKKLKQIVDSLAARDNRFIKDDLYRILEVTEDGKQEFTGFYADNENTVYTSRAWSKKLIVKKKEAQKERLARFDEQKEELEQAKKTRMLKALAGFAIVLTIIVGIVYSMWSSTDTPQDQISNENESNATPLSEFSSVKVDTTFGNARITGSDVNVREQPNLNAAIIDLFPKEGEYVKILQPATDTLSWYQVARKDGSSGWVFSQYVQEINRNNE